MRNGCAEASTRRARAGHQPPGRAVVKLDALVEDFRISAAASRSMIDEMPRRGARAARRARRRIRVTEKFRALRAGRDHRGCRGAGAKMLLTHVADLAWQFNRTARENKRDRRARGFRQLHEPRARTRGSYRRDHRSPEPPPLQHPTAGRATHPLQGREQIRELIEGQSRYLRAYFFHDLDDVPRPFSVLFKSHG
jgi:hypothetical protein